MAINKDNEVEENSEATIDETTPVVSRAQSNYSTQRTKLLIAPTKYGENRAQYLWRLLRCSIRRTIEAVSRADDADIERSHGLHFVRNINHDIQVKCISFNIKRKEIISFDHKRIARIYHSDGRAYKKLKLDIAFDQLFYCINEDEFIAWSRWSREIHVFSSDLEILSTSTCDYNIGDLSYNEMTSDVFTCGRGVTVWQFRYNRKHLLPKFECREGYTDDIEFNIMAAQQTNGSIQRLFVTSGYDVLAFNVADEGKVFSTKQDLHVRPIVGMLFIELRDVLVTAGRDGSIKVWDDRWFILYAYVGHQDRILCLSKHPFGPYVISSSQDRTIRVWSLEYGDVVDVIKVPEPISQMNVTRNYEKFIVASTKCLQLWCIKHYCDFLSFIGSPIIKIICTTHPDYPTRSALLCKDSTVRIIASATGDILTSLVCDLNFKATSCAYAIGENTLFVSNGNRLIKADTSLNPCKIVQQFDTTEYSINCLLIYEYVAKSNMEETPMLKALVTKPSSELIHIALKGFSRTLLIAGLNNGCIAVLKWHTGEIDFSLDMHSARPVADIIAHASADQIISCGVDLIIRIWRVFPYAVESLSVVRSIFCALPPVHLTIVKNSLAVAFREESTLTHSLMVYNLENNERFDHLPENDHCDKISAISGCSKLKLIATGSLDGTLRIWNGKNQLIRMIVIHDNIHSLHFSNDSGDLILGIGDHLYKMLHSSYLPKAIIFKTISMEFKPTIPEIKESEEIDNTQITRMSSADLIRLKRAHKAEKMPLNIVPENVDISAFQAKSVEDMKLKTQELEKLEKRDLEIAQIAEGKIHRTKKYKISSKVRKEAFNEYMKIYLKEPKKGLLDEDMYKLTEQELFGPPITKPDPYVIQIDDDGFFPSVKEANQDPLSKFYEKRQEKLSELQEHYRNQPPFLNDDIRIIKQQQDKYELKKLLNNNVEKITLPGDRPQYGPGAIVPNSVLAKLLWPNRQPKKQEREEWVPPVLSEEQLQALEKTTPVDEEAEWKELIEATMKKKLAADEDDMDDRLEKQKKKTQSDFMKQLTDLAHQVVEPSPPPQEEPVIDESKQPEPGAPPSSSQTTNRLARQTPLRRPPVVVKPSPPSKPARIPVKPLIPIVTESTQTVETRVKTPRQFSPSFVRFVDKLKELNWFEEQYPLVKVDIFLENCDENAFPSDVLQRLDFISNIENRIIVLQELENFYRTNSINDQTRDTLIERILFHLTKFNPPNYGIHDIELISTYLRLLAHLNKMTMEVVAEFIYWYLDGGDHIRAFVKALFQQCGLDDPFGHFYNEMDSWKLWELDPNQSRRVGIKALAFEWLRQWIRAFRTHIEEMHVRLKNGDIHVQISNATSRALTGDTSLSTRSSVNGKNLTVTLDALPRIISSNISSIEVINYFVEITQEQINERNQPREKPDNNTILVLPKINKPTALVRLGESHTDFHRPIKRNPIYLPHEHRFEPGEFSMGRCVNYPVRKLFLDPFRRQIFTEDIEFEDTEPYLLTLKLAPKYFLPTLSQVTKT
ncbi:unnamed protein product [Rotaria sordida]|uniref:WD repeat-containing protein 97 n=1 Tax=Rotaria sordida TaxID=392033 RepID=A0A813MWG0_9BILA|nr:unnamed protein product [Rotaria sordida]CAF1127229.1 unnamed protein product [Rotaria sordida]